MTRTPDPADALEPAVAALLAAGRADLAAELLRQAALPTPPGATAAGLHRAGLAHLSAGRAAEAEAALRLAARLSPATASVHDHLGVALASQKRYAEAEATFAVAERLAPADPSPRRNRGQAGLDQKKYAAAVEVYRRAAAAEPQADDLVLQLAVALSGLKQYAEAADRLQAVVDAGRGTVAVWDRLGVVRGLAGDPAAAADCFRKQLAVAPDAAGGWANLAAALGKLNDWPGAADAGKRAVELAPDAAAGWGNLGNALRDLGRLDEAVPALETAVRLEPTQPEAAGNLALALAMRGDVEAALPWYDRAVAAAPDAAEARFNRAIALLSLGDYARGWPEYEWRFATAQMKAHARPAGAPPWRGEPLAGKTILVTCEQGHGDTLQFIRLVPRLAEQGATVVLLAAAPLKRLLETAPGVAKVAAAGETITGVDYVCPLLTLPLLMQLRVDTIPHDVPSVTAPAADVAKWRDVVAALPGRKVGIAWQGNPNHVGDRWRSVPLTRFAPLAAVPGVTLVGVQLGAGREQLAVCPFPVADLAAGVTGDFGDTAGLLTHLDLVVTVDSAVAHLAGCLARPVWVALPVNMDWRWLRHRADSPWYPTMRLFRQGRFGEWGPVFDRMAGELASRA